MTRRSLKDHLKSQQTAKKPARKKRKGKPKEKRSATPTDTPTPGQGYLPDYPARIWWALKVGLASCAGWGSDEAKAQIKVLEAIRQVPELRAWMANSNRGTLEQYIQHSIPTEEDGHG